MHNNSKSMLRSNFVVSVATHLFLYRLNKRSDSAGRGAGDGGGTKQERAGTGGIIYLKFEVDEPDTFSEPFSLSASLFSSRIFLTAGLKSGRSLPW